MPFVKFNARYQKDVAYINISVSNMAISNKAFEILGKPEKVHIYYDKENSQIKLAPHSNGQKIHNYPKQKFLCAKLSKVMPKGRYYWVKDNLFQTEIKK